MSGFFAEDQFWDMTQADEAVLAAALAQLETAGLTGVLGELRRLWASAEADHARFSRLAARRAAREPLSHLLGYRDFYKHRFTVTPDVLDPRPDTETLVIEALNIPFDSVLDLGTGSGCILLSLLSERPFAKGVGTDVSPNALKVALGNAQRLGIETATFVQSDWYAQVAGQFDLIVSNPPYIAAVEMDGLQAEVRDHEPRMALTDGADGLSCYRQIIAGAPERLTPRGYLMVEIGLTQADAVSQMMAAKGFAKIRVIQDLDVRDRVVLGQKSGD